VSSENADPLLATVNGDLAQDPGCYALHALIDLAGELAEGGLV